MVDVSVQEDCAGDGRLANSVARTQLRRGFDLRAQVGGCSQQKPRLAVLSDSHLSLGARFTAKASGSQAAAVGTAAIPLRKSAPRA